MLIHEDMYLEIQFYMSVDVTTNKLTMVKRRLLSLGDQIPKHSMKLCRLH